MAGTRGAIDSAHVSSMLWCLVWLVLIKIAAGFWNFSLGIAHDGGGPSFIYISLVISFAAAAVTLFLSSHERRGVYLAAFFALVASTFAERFARLPNPAWPILAILGQLPFDAFLPLVLALFVRDFPEAPFYLPAQRWADHLVAASAVCSVALFAGNAFELLAPRGLSTQTVISATSRRVYSAESTGRSLHSDPARSDRDAGKASPQRRRSGHESGGLFRYWSRPSPADSMIPRLSRDRQSASSLSVSMAVPYSGLYRVKSGVP